MNEPFCIDREIIIAIYKNIYHARLAAVGRKDKNIYYKFVKLNVRG
jgi:hypothetical protein